MRGFDVAAVQLSGPPRPTVTVPFLKSRPVAVKCDTGRVIIKLCSISEKSGSVTTELPRYM